MRKTKKVKFNPILALRNALAGIIDGEDAKSAMTVAKRQIDGARKLKEVAK